MQKERLISLDKVCCLKRLLIIFLAILSLIIPYTSDISIYLAFLGLAALAVGLISIKLIMKKIILTSWQKLIFFSSLIYMLYFVFMVMISHRNEFQIIQWSRMLTGIAIALVMIFLAPSKKEIKIILLILVIGCVFSSTLGIWQYLYLGQKAHGLNSMNPNYFGGYLVAVAPVAIAWLFAARGKKELFPAGGAGLITVAALFFTFCRGSILALFIAVFCMSWWLRSYWLFPGLLGYYSLCGHIAPAVYKRFLPLATGVIDSSSIQRLHLWRAALELWKTKPFLGAGIGGYRLFGPDFGLPDTVLIENRFAYNCHNSYLEILADQGLVGLAAFLGLLAVFFFPVLRRLFSGKTADPWLAGMAGGIVGFLGQNMTNSLFLYNTISWAAWLLLGLAACWIRTGPEGGEPACAS